MSDKPRPALARDFPAAYALIYPVVADVARELGYCAALYGSLARDLDIVCVPWVEEAVAPDQLVRAIAEHCWIGPLVAEAKVTEPELKPHGRLSWALALKIGAYLDLSVIPPRSGA